MESLPTGTVTFLYTDIESSTKRWEAHPVAMKAAVERHDAILREVIEARGGTVFRTMGDAFCAVFDLAGDALAGALEAQRALQKEEWDGEIAPIKVRMAMHTGTGEVRDGDYVGTPLNRIARLLNTGYGGQILLSRTAYDLVRDTLPQGVTLQDLGEHRLKDLQRPEHIFQVVASELEGDHPPLKTLDYRPNNLPVERSPLIGREAELAQVTRLLLRDDVGVLTMTGPGGIGKTRLSLQAAAELIDRFQDGVFVVMLAHVTDPALVAQAIVQTLGVKENPGKQAAESLGDYLSDKKMLLVLDNFEQVVEAAPVVAGLLAKASGLKMLVTSREALHVRGEQEYAVPPLGLPDPKQLPSIERMSQYDAVALFIQRARMVKPDFEINNENAPAVAEICHKLDGLPLAIELAAARVRLLPPRALLERLSSRLRLLTGGGRDLPARQQTLRGAIQWSYDLLHAGEQLLFRRISVFIGGCGLDAIETICNADMALDVDTLDAVASLVDKSLARQEPGGDSEPRIVMLDTIREYGMELLKDDPTDAGDISRRHAEYYTALAEEAAPGIQGPEQSEWLGRMDDERENINGAFQWALATGEAEIALRICGAMINFWQFRGLTSEESTWAESALALPGAQERTAHRATALLSASVIAVRDGDTDQVLALAEESASIWREIGGNKGDRGLGQTLTMLALAYFQTDLEKGKALLYEGVELLRKTAAKVEVATSLLDVGIMTASIGDYALVESTYEEALVMFREARDNWGISQVLNALGDLMRISGNYAKARGLYEESLALYRKLDIRPDIPASLHNLGYVALAEGDTARARELFAEALGLQLAQKNRQGVAECIAGLAGVAAALGQGERSARLYGALVAQGYGKGVIMWAAEQVEFERNRAKSRALLDEEDWQEAWMEGRAMMLEQAIAYALAES